MILMRWGLKSPCGSWVYMHCSNTIMNWIVNVKLLQDKQSGRTQLPIIYSVILVLIMFCCFFILIPRLFASKIFWRLDWLWIYDLIFGSIFFLIWKKGKQILSSEWCYVKRFVLKKLSIIHFWFEKLRNGFDIRYLPSFLLCNWRVKKLLFLTLIFSLFFTLLKGYFVYLSWNYKYYYKLY